MRCKEGKGTEPVFVRTKELEEKEARECEESSSKWEEVNSNAIWQRQQQKQRRLLFSHSHQL